MNVIYAVCGWPSKPLPDPVAIRNMYLHLSKLAYRLCLLLSWFRLPSSFQDSVRTTLAIWLKPVVSKGYEMTNHNVEFSEKRTL